MDILERLGYTMWFIGVALSVAALGLYGLIISSAPGYEPGLHAVLLGAAAVPAIIGWMLRFILAGE